MSTSFDLTELLGDELLASSKGEKVSVKDLQESTDVLGLYFSAHWCPPCRGFTPVLAEKYKEIIGEKKSFDIVFISSDQDQAAFDGYFKEQPWKALPYGDRAKKNTISNKYEVRGIPTLVILNAKTGEIITKDGRSAVGEHGVAAFPFSPESVKKCKAEKRQQMSEKFADNFSKNFQAFGSEKATIGNTGEEVSLSDICKKKVIGLFVLSAKEEPIHESVKTMLIPKLNEIRENVAKEKGADAFEFLCVPIGDTNGCQKLVSFPTLPADSKYDTTLSGVFGEVDDIGVYLVSGDGKSVLSDKNEVGQIFQTGEKGYPWSD